MSTTYTLWANLQELQHLPEDSEYLFHNYDWKKHPAFDNVMELSFAEWQEAAAIYHELWHVRFNVPSLKRSWA